MKLFYSALITSILFSQSCTRSKPENQALEASPTPVTRSICESENVKALTQEFGRLEVRHSLLKRATETSPSEKNYLALLEFETSFIQWIDLNQITVTGCIELDPVSKKEELEKSSVYLRRNFPTKAAK